MSPAAGRGQSYVGFWDKVRKRRQGQQWSSRVRSNPLSVAAACWLGRARFGQIRSTSSSAVVAFVGSRVDFEQLNVSGEDVNAGERKQ
jgi:hypothetical protein